jgi:hypothetical protein
MSFQLDEVSRILVDNGVITVNVIYTKTGLDVWARSVQSHPGLGVYPHESILLEELYERFAKHSCLKNINAPTSATGEDLSSSAASPNDGVKLPLHIRERPTTPPKGKQGARKLLSESDVEQSVDDWSAMEKMSIGQAQALARKFRLNEVNIGTMSNILPADSLSGLEMSRDIYSLFIRAVCVADKLGSKLIYSRIVNQQSLQVKGSANLTQWWFLATGEQRLRVLSSAKKLNISEVKPAKLKEFGSIPCPFRGAPEEFQVSEDLVIRDCSSGAESNSEEE